MLVWKVLDIAQHTASFSASVSVSLSDTLRRAEGGDAGTKFKARSSLTEHERSESIGCVPNAGGSTFLDLLGGLFLWRYLVAGSWIGRSKFLPTFL